MSAAEAKTVAAVAPMVAAVAVETTKKEEGEAGPVYEALPVVEKSMAVAFALPRDVEGAMPWGL